MLGRTHLHDAFGSRAVVLVAGFDEAVAAAEMLERARRLDAVEVFSIVPEIVAKAEISTIADSQGRVRDTLDLAPGSFYLVRPDGHVAARGRDATSARLVAAVDRMLGVTSHAARP